MPHTATGAATKLMGNFFWKAVKSQSSALLASRQQEQSGAFRDLDTPSDDSVDESPTPVLQTKQRSIVSFPDLPRSPRMSPAASTQIYQKSQRKATAQQVGTPLEGAPMVIAGSTAKASEISISKACDSCLDSQKGQAPDGLDEGSRDLNPLILLPGTQQVTRMHSSKVSLLDH